MLLFDDRYRESGRFFDSDPFYILVFLKDHGRSGIGAVADALGISVSSARAMVRLLEGDGLAEHGSKGASITRLGLAVLRAVPVVPLDIDTDLVLGDYRQAVKVRGMADQITSGIPQARISGIVGAAGCTTWVVEGGKLVMPPHKYVDPANRWELERLTAEGELEEGDVLLVCGAENKRSARAAALFVALELL